MQHKTRLELLLFFLYVFSLQALAEGSTSTRSTTETPTEVTTNGYTLPQNTTTPKPPTTLSPFQLKRIYCETRYTLWKFPTISTCTSPFLNNDKCSLHIVNSTNELLDCKTALQKVPSTLGNIMYIPNAVDYLGKTMSTVFNKWRSKTPNAEKFRKLRYIYKYVVFEAGIDFKWKDLELPNYERKDLFPTHKWNNCNNSIKLPYASIPAGLFQYSFVMYSNMITGFVTRPEVRLKKAWKHGHVISSGLFIDYSVEDGLIFKPQMEINSDITSLSVVPDAKDPLPSELVIVFKHKKTTLSNPWCVYWQYVTLSNHHIDEGYGEGYWSNYGMSVRSTNKTHTICLSSHMSVFAVLMEPPSPEDDGPQDLFLMATIGMTVLSIIILIVYMITMVVLGCLQTVYSRIYMSIAVACFLSQVVFVLALNARDDWDKCTTFAIIMELCHVTVMSWTTNEAVHQLSRLRYFFNEKTNKDAFYNLFGWGFPLAVMVALFGYPHKHYTSLRFCWLYVEGLEMWYFCGPLFILLLISSIIRLITYLHIRKNIIKIEKDINYTRAWLSLKASVVILPTMGAIWLIATFAVRNSEGHIGGLLMLSLPLLNLLVGVFIFYFYFYQNDEVKDALIEQIKYREKTRLLRYEHLKGMAMNVAYVPGQEESDSDEEEENSEKEEKEEENTPQIQHKKSKDSFHAF